MLGKNEKHCIPYTPRKTVFLKKNGLHFGVCDHVRHCLLAHYLITLLRAIQLLRARAELAVAVVAHHLEFREHSGNNRGT